MNRPRDLLADLLADLAKLAAIGMIIAAGAGALLFLGGFLFGGSTANGLETGKDGLLLIASLGILLLAGAIMARGKGSGAASPAVGWRRMFKAAGYKTALGAVCICLIAAAAVFDALIRRFPL